MVFMYVSHNPCGYCRGQGTTFHLPTPPSKSGKVTWFISMYLWISLLLQTMSSSQYRKLVTHILQYPYIVDLTVTISMCMFISFLLIKYCNTIYNILVWCVATGATTNLMI